MNLRRRQRLSRLTLILVAVMFLTPFLFAFVLNRLGWHPEGGRNNGELIEPPQALGELALVDRRGEVLPLVNLDHRWTWVVRVPVACDDACAQRLDEMHRVRYSLNRHAPKLAIRLLAPAVLPALPPSMQALNEDSTDALMESAPRIAHAPDWSGFLIDDKAYLMLHFPPDMEARLIRRDLGRLIR